MIDKKIKFKITLPKRLPITETSDNAPEYANILEKLLKTTHPEKEIDYIDKNN